MQLPPSVLLDNLPILKILGVSALRKRIQMEFDLTIAVLPGAKTGLNKHSPEPSSKSICLNLKPKIHSTSYQQAAPEVPEQLPIQETHL